MDDPIWKSHCSDPTRILLHASAVAMQGQGLLIVGPSGSGKSGLALELMASGADLVADDKVWVDQISDQLTLSAPQSLVGRIEARGLGILSATPQPTVPLSYAIDLSKNCEARLPLPRFSSLLGKKFRVIAGKGVPGLSAGIRQLLKCGFSSND